MKGQEDSLRKEAQELQAFLSQPDAYADPDFATKSRRASELEATLSLFDAVNTTTEQLSQAKEMSASDEADLAALAQAESPELEAELDKLSAKLEDALIPSDPNDEKNVIVEIRAGAGGDEAS